MEQINYEPYLKDWKPPEDLIEWAIKQGALNREYLIYRSGWEYVPLEDRNRRAVEVTCTKCGKTFIADRVDADSCGRYYPSGKFGWWNSLLTENVISGSTTKCPICRADAETVHIGNINHYIQTENYVTQIIRLPIPGKTDRLVLLEWQIYKRAHKSGACSYGTWLWTAWVVEEKKVVRLKGWNRFLSSICYTYISQKKTFLDDYGQRQFVYPFEEATLYGTTGENCKLDRYIQQDGLSLVAYLALWRKKPSLENLIVQGCGKLVEEMIHDAQHRYTYSRSKGIPTLPEINWKEKKPHLMLRMTKEEFRQYGRELTAKDLHIIATIRKAGIPVNLSEHMPLLRMWHPYEVERVSQEQPPELFWKIMNYTRQAGRDYITLRDYWAMANTLEMDLDNQQVRWPKDLKGAHDRVTKEYKKRKTKILTEAFEKRRQELELLAWHCNGLLIRPCATQEEMNNEGKLLHHCVSRYAEDHAMGKTAIFFIRLESEPEKPFFTLEWDEKNHRVLQNRGNHNCARTPEVELFEKMWLDWMANRGRNISITIRRKSA